MYQSNYTGEQIDEAVGKALVPDTVPIENSTNLITSGAVNEGIQTAVGRPLLGAENPTIGTQGVLGQLYTNTTTNHLWQLKQITTTEQGTTYTWVDLSNVLPSVTSADNGKVLKVVNGVWAVASL